MTARSLKALLTRQWMAFAMCIAVLFASAGLLLLFLLEDSFIDRQLEAAARSIASPSPSPDLARLPAEFSVYPVEQVPRDIHARLPFTEVGEPFEMRRLDRRYVHVLVVDTADKGRLAVVYDVTDQLTVSPQLGTGLLFLLGLTAAVLLAAAALAHAFVGRISKQAGDLIDDVKSTPNPQRLRDVAEKQQILEFQHLLALHADVWEAQLAAVESERQTLAYLGHELRTPLQSAQTSFALLAEKRGDLAALERLQRALARLTRASRSILWLATDRVLDVEVSTRLLPVIYRLVEEFSPHAAHAGQVIDIDMPDGLTAQGPDEIVETILANLLLNAIQHGAPGHVSIHGSAGLLAITNSVCRERERGGFGFGLEIVHRLAHRIGWTVDVKESDDVTTTHIHLQPIADGTF